MFASIPKFTFRALYVFELAMEPTLVYGTLSRLLSIWFAAIRACWWMGGWRMIFAADLDNALKKTNNSRVTGALRPRAGA